MIRVGSNHTIYSQTQAHPGLARVPQGHSRRSQAVSCTSHTRRTFLCAPVMLGGVNLQEAQAAPFNVELPWSGFLTTQPEPVRVPRCTLSLALCIFYFLNYVLLLRVLAREPCRARPAHVPPAACRKQLNQNFAVLLMRSTYDSVDALDFIAMDKFQVKFWKTRQAEFESYKLMMEPVSVPIGNLSSPVYFDFIAFSLYAAISNAIPDAPQVFEVRAAAHQVVGMGSKPGNRTQSCNFVCGIQRSVRHGRLTTSL
jgi:hypothetical protein